MNFDMKKPCSTCPFRKESTMRLTRGRVKEITGAIMGWPGETFQCHNTVDYEQEHHGMEKGAQHCAGALIFALKNNHMGQLARIASRLRMFNPDELMADKTATNLVPDTMRQLLAIHCGSRTRSKQKA